MVGAQALALHPNRLKLGQLQKGLNIGHVTNLLEIDL